MRTGGLRACPLLDRCESWIERKRLGYNVRGKTGSLDQMMVYDLESFQVTPICANLCCGTAVGCSTAGRVKFAKARQPEGRPGVLHGGIGSLPGSQAASTLQHIPRDSAKRKTNAPDRHRRPNCCRGNRNADLPRQSERLRDRKRKAAVLQRKRRGTADAADPDWCPTAGQHSDVESEHGLVEENVAVRPRRRCSTLTERRHAAGASLAAGAPDTTSERRISLRVGHSKRKRASGESSI